MPQVGDIVSQYQLVRQIGKGGMGVVWEAVHTRIRSKRAAVKVLHPGAARDPALVARFEREAEAAAGIGHEGIIDIYDLGVSGDGSPYMVMEYLEGESLKERIKRTVESGQGATLDLDLAVYVGCNVLSALSAAHRAGVVHRDLKPDNIFLVQTSSRWPWVKLLDFGIARMREAYGAGQEALTLTEAGAVIGTPYFMSPEQALGFKERIDHRTDLWSLGVTLYLCATGQHPFGGENYAQVVARVVSSLEPAGPRQLNPAIPQALEQVILGAMCRDLSRRYATADDMLADLSTLADESTLNLLALADRRAPNGTPPADLTSLPSDAAWNRPPPSLPDTGKDELEPEAGRDPASPGVVHLSPVPQMPETQPTEPSDLESTTTPTLLSEGGGKARPDRRQRLVMVALAVAAVMLALIGVGVVAFMAVGSGGSEQRGPAAAPEPASPPKTPPAKTPVVPIRGPEPGPAEAAPAASTEAERQGPPAEPEPTAPEPEEPPAATEEPDAPPREAEPRQEAPPEQRFDRREPRPGPRPSPPGETPTPAPRPGSPEPPPRPTQERYGTKI